MKRWKQLVAVAGGVCLLVGLVLVPATVSASPDNQVSITLPYSTMDEGAQFTMDVAIDNITNFDACNYDVVVDPANVLNLTAVTDGDISATTIPVIGFNSISTYPLKDAWRVAENVPGLPGVSGTGYFATLHFTVIGSDTSTCTISLEDGVVSDNTATEIICNWTGTGTLTIDRLEVTAISVVGELATSEGYVVPHQPLGCTTETNFTMTPTVSGGTGAATYTYAWTFGADGSGATTASAPSDVTYGSSGAKTVDLRVTDALSSTSEGYEVSGSADVYDTLVAGYSGDTGTVGHPQEGMVKWDTTQWVSTVNYPSTVTFDSSTSTGGKVTYTYSWDFNNDTTQDSADADPAAFDFAIFPGTDSNFEGAKYINVLTVNDSLTASDDETKTDYITIYAAGDVNGDLGIDSTDITAIELIVAGINPETLTSDVNDDGNVNAIDITATELAAL